MDQKTDYRTPLRYLKGVGPERSKVFLRLGLQTLGDLFYFFPRRHENRRPIKKVSELELNDEKQCVMGTITSRGFIRTKYGQTMFRTVITDGAKTLIATWFNMPYLHKIFTPKSNVIFYGKPEKEGNHFQMIHPEYEIVQPEASEFIHSGRIVPVYGLTEDLTQKTLRQMAYKALQETPVLCRDFLSADQRRRFGWTDKASAIRQAHFPDDEKKYEAAYKRLVFDEFFLMQICVQMRRAEMQKQNKEILHSTGEDQVAALLKSFAYEPTAGQKKTIAEIMKDMRRDRPMNRLVQGDVGSGKTLVAAAGLVFTAANGFQGALMAPTEVLAQQHYFNLTQLLEPLGIRCGYLANGAKAEDREKTLADIASGQIQIVVGTHALIQNDVRFQKLGLVVIDEQHKFGVFQRATLKEKAKTPPHCLLLTATPIPRTLALTLYGDLDISEINEMPKGRKPIQTIWVGENRRAEIYAFLDGLLDKGRQAFVICPLIETADGTIKSASQIHAEMTKRFPNRQIGLLHGRMKNEGKNKVMQEFKSGKLQVLVSTVVIEVGVDVPNASAMIIENAERFGLAQLHQLRGRVGRGSEDSFCVLFSDATQEESVERLAAFEKIHSGFEIAETDLQLRGSGDIIGEKQHGLQKLRIGDLVRDMDILRLARTEAQRIVEKDPKLTGSENRLLKMEIQERFGRDQEKIAVFN